MRAMTWWDHETRSVWAQPWGMAIDGPLWGTALDLIPASIVSWKSWLSEHPDTLVLTGADRGIIVGANKRFSDRYVIGITLGDHAKSYPFEAASREGIVNDRIGPFPVVVLADPDTKSVHVYFSTVGDEELEFDLRDGRLTDRQTGSTWDVSKGLAVEGPHRGELLKQVPYISAFDWAWEDFYPPLRLFRVADLQGAIPTVGGAPP